MALDVLILGPFVFDSWSTPERLPFGGKQQLNVHKMPGGSRTIDAMGPDDHDRAFSAKFQGSSALSDALTIDALRVQGAELSYSNGVEARTVIIADFTPHVIKFNYIEFDITLTTSDDSGTGVGGIFGIGLAAIDGIVGTDLSAAVGLLS